MSIQDEQKRLQRERSKMGHQLKELHRQEEISVEEEMKNRPRSVCCKAPMQEENDQCLCCGAGGSHFEDENDNPIMSEAEKQELIDEKIR